MKAVSPCRHLAVSVVIIGASATIPDSAWSHTIISTWYAVLSFINELAHCNAIIGGRWTTNWYAF